MNNPSLTQFFFKKNELQPVKLNNYQSSDSALCQMFRILKYEKRFVIEISGHCSEIEKNKEQLSFNRAKFVKDTLVKLGINPARIVTKSYSDKRPREVKDENGMVLPEKVKDEENQRVVFSVIRRDFEE